MLRSGYARLTLTWLPTSTIGSGRGAWGRAPCLLCGYSDRCVGRSLPRLDVVECLMRVTYDDEANAAYVELEDDATVGSAVENIVVERPGRGDIVLDFDAEGRLLGVEVIGARELLRTAVLNAANQI